MQEDLALEQLLQIPLQPFVYPTLLRLFQRFALDRVKYSPKTGQPN
jgi:hypothetical protein